MRGKEIFETYISASKYIQEIVDEIYDYMLENYKGFFKIKKNSFNSWRVIDDYGITKKPHLVLKYVASDYVNVHHIFEIPIGIVYQNKWKTYIKTYVNKNKRQNYECIR